jgi:lysylphosphatidylglycerol synthetase-like protein (DUF2156 family)
MAGRIKNFFRRKDEWLTTGVFITVLLVVSFSGFKLPHYLNIVFPATAVMTAAFIISMTSQPKWIKIIFTTQLVIVGLLLLLAVVINAWAFPVKSVWVIIGVMLLLAIVFYFMKSKNYDPLQKAVLVSVAAMALSFFLLNSNFYPQLLKYQGGNELAFSTKGKVDPLNVYFWKDNYSSSYNFYTATPRKLFADSVFRNNMPVWLLVDIRNLEDVKRAGYHLGQSYSALDYEITRLDIRFVNPARREKECTKMMLIELSGKSIIRPSY